MATTILLKSNSISGTAPRVDELSYSELAINTADGYLFTRTTNDQIVNLTSWDQLHNKPTTFTPDQHQHVINDISNLQTELDNKQVTGNYVLDSDVRLSDARIPLSHTHAINEIVNLQSSLDNKQDAGDYVLDTDSRLSDARTPTAHYHNSGNFDTNIGVDSLSLQNDNNQYFGFRNTAIGSQSLNANTYGSDNTAVGSSSMYSNTIGKHNAIFGSYAATFNTDGSSNAAFGTASLANNVNGSNNVALGGGSLYSNTTGINNVAVGTYCCANNTTGSYNTVLGFDAKLDLNSLENCIVLGAGATAFSNSEFVLGSSSRPLNTSASVGSSGSASSLPSNPLGYLNVRLNGNIIKIPFYRE